VGAGNEVNDRIAISIGSAKVSALGIGSNSSYSKVLAQGTTVSNVALASGQLSINGAQIGASSSDGVSYTNADSSAIAKAGAINAASGLTGVTATVSKTEVAGVAADNSNEVAAGEVMINGVDIGAIGASGSPVQRGVQTAAAINAKTSQTGVTATASTSTGAVSLVATDGRNITISSTTAGGLSTGLKTTVAGVVPTSVKNATFKINGVEMTYAPPNPAAVTVTNTTNGAAAVSGGAAAQTEVANIAFEDLTAGQVITLNGLTFTAGTTGTKAAEVASAFSGITSGASLLTVQAAVATAHTAAGTTATGTLSGTAFTAGFSTAAKSSPTATNVTATASAVGVATDIAPTGMTSAADHATGIAAVITAKALQSGVRATASAGVITLTVDAKDGRGIELSGGASAMTGLTDQSSSTTAKITLSTNGDKGIVLGGDTGAASTGQVANKGFNASVLSSSGGVDLSTAAGSQAALSVLDKAINTVTDSRASMGAYQNRLTASVANLEVTSMNLQASRSRILDTDYAKETTNLAKSQIIQQAATAMLAQANQSAQSVLSLLK
jgi:flagellin